LGATVFFLFVLTPCHVNVWAQDVVLRWDKPDDNRVTGYKIYYGLQDSKFTSSAKQEVDSQKTTSFRITDLEIGSTYRFAARSVDSFGNESMLSQIFYYDVRSLAAASEDEGSGCWLKTISLDL